MSWGRGIWRQCWCVHCFKDKSHTVELCLVLHRGRGGGGVPYCGQLLGIVHFTCGLDTFLKIKCDQQTVILTWYFWERKFKSYTNRLFWEWEMSQCFLPSQDSNENKVMKVEWLTYQYDPWPSPVSGPIHHWFHHVRRQTKWFRLVQDLHYMLIVQL